jgi:hypothetical protein
LVAVERVTVLWVNATDLVSCPISSDVTACLLEEISEARIETDPTI